MLRLGLALLTLLVVLGLIAGGWNALPALGTAGDIIRVSGDNADDDSLLPSISGDGRYVVFESRATDLVPGDDNFDNDVFLYDSQSGDISLISEGISGGSGNDQSTDPSISADGRYVVFMSEADDLVPNDNNGVADIFFYNVNTSARSIVSVGNAGNSSDGISTDPSISGDGRYVAFASAASNLVGGDTNGTFDIFVRDRVGGTTNLITTDANGNPLISGTFHAIISDDGRWVAYETRAHGIVPGDGNNLDDIYLHELSTGNVTHVTQADGGGTSNGDSQDASISGDGRYVAYYTAATDIVPGDNNGMSDVVRYDRVTGDSIIVSVNGTGDPANGFSDDPAISGSGRYVAFSSDASDLANGDTNAEYDVFIRDVVAGSTTLASSDTNGGPADGESYEPALSSDSKFLAYQSRATDLIAGDRNGWMDVFRYQYLPDPPPPTTSTSPTTTTTSTTTSTSPTTSTSSTTSTRAPTTSTTTTIPEESPEDPVDSFTDDDGHLFEDDINAIAAAGITRGCNPPVNDRYCPNDSFTRGQAAAFIRRALQLPASVIDAFTDDDGSVFEGDINAVAAAGVTRGCNPPQNDNYCPNDSFTRGQAAAFLRRALGLPPSSTDFFTDDTGDVFETDINAVAEAGITRGCNPPQNDNYCPNDSFTRGQAAAFIRRALGY